MMLKTNGLIGVAAVLLVVAGPAPVRADDTKTCPVDPREAAHTMWPMKEAFAPQMRMLKGKHACGQWLRCERRLKTTEWHCKWLGDKES
ncbi:hypothetical protein SAMN04515647_2053 [Cohaesibacter sp. ES.047]|uniref:hypothetical protein n=1 Tax=Cohaesibacter sp. ES.047 TaxID=1798205 RepID=UPI000BB744A4|nr:hypothetical protein [Cohaesibacter sp. ES.047]SNY91811.1 hypothetical protein SAMN04515647_2053 [Cohaesibacter sp. ES.047]